MYETMEAPMMESDNWKKREQALLKRLQKLPKKNEIVKLAIKRKKADVNRDEMWKQFDVVEELVSAARKSCMDGEDFSETVMDLAEALKALVDKGSQKEETED